MEIDNRWVVAVDPAGEHGWVLATLRNAAGMVVASASAPFQANVTAETLVQALPLPQVAAYDDEPRNRAERRARRYSRTLSKSGHDYHRHRGRSQPTPPR